ncbi:MAG: CoA ester lyase [Chloroflexi bacterium]|nr:MAG: CoA ester lyase [Chloroflexota bacterium]
MRLLRSLMFVPGHSPRMVQRALGVGEFAASQLDVAILDLEDGVPPDEKDRARAAVAAALGFPSDGEGPARYVRVNRDPGPRDADLAAVLRPGLHGIVAPKVDHPDEVASLARDLDEREDAAGIARGSIPVIASIESARGLLAAHEVAASTERVIALLFGAEDFARDLSLPTERLGFAGKSLIHPGQIDVCNEIFSPSPAEVSYARRVVGAFEEAQVKGHGAVALDGRLLDPPIVERARQALALHDAVSRKQRTPPVERPAALEGKRLK